MARRKKNKNLKGIPAAIMLILALIGGFAERGNLNECLVILYKTLQTRLRPVR